jgi:hypothetical protein
MGMGEIQRYEVQGYGVQDIREDDSGEFVRWDDVKHLIGKATKQKATQPPAVGVDVTDEMVERACAAFYADDAWVTNTNRARDFMREALTAALRTGGGADHG